MKVVEQINEMQILSDDLKKSGKSIACVPTMGYLHEGHLSLVDESVRTGFIVVVTLFVNPTQFSPTEDLKKYPRNLDRDIALLENRGCHYLFAPDENEMYPDDYSTFVKVSGLTSKFEGKYRPEHFQGVTTIVAKLFNIISPDVAVFGQKDFQQTLVIKKMAVELNMATEIIVAPTVREKDGLAMSSRNIYLSEKEREKALVINRALFETKNFIESGNLNRELINNKIKEILSTIPDIEIDYAVSALTDNLAEPEYFAIGDEIVLLIAVRIGTTRLIDNILIKI